MYNHPLFFKKKFYIFNNRGNKKGNKLDMFFYTKIYIYVMYKQIRKKVKKVELACVKSECYFSYFR